MYCDLIQREDGKLECVTCGAIYPARPLPFRTPCKRKAKKATKVPAAKPADPDCNGCEGDKVKTPAEGIADARKKQESGYQHPPTFLRLIGNFAKSLKDFASDGFRLCSRQQYEARMEVCSTCPLRIGRRCGACGCVLAAKSRAIIWKCPKGYWEDVDARFTDESQEQQS